MTRKMEAAVGGRVLKFARRKLVERARLVKKEVVLEDGLVVHYYEYDGGVSGKQSTAARPTLLLCHGMTDEAKNLAPVVGFLRKKLPHWRMIIPDLIGHGHDLERAKKVGVDKFDYPTPMRLLQSMEDLLKALQIQECSVFGISLGGALAYYLQHAHPAVVRKAILISPAIEHVVDETFIDDFTSRRKNHFCVESRQDCKDLFRDLSCTHRTKNNPVPKFFLEAVWQDRLKREPSQHFRTYFSNLLDAKGKDPEGTYMGSSTDIAPHARRLVVWPQDDHIANHDKGKAYFDKSPGTQFQSIPECGHLFHSNGQNIIELAAPLIVDFLKEEEKPSSPR
jgi:pimeloyl-ACP methyl ester carboxylesterase